MSIDSYWLNDHYALFRMYEEGSRGLLPGSPHTKRRLRRGTASTVSEGETPRRDALHDLIAESEVIQL